MKHAETWGQRHSGFACLCVQFGSGHGVFGVDGPAILGVMELCLALNDACSVTLFYFCAVLK